MFGATALPLQSNGRIYDLAEHRSKNGTALTSAHAQKYTYDTRAPTVVLQHPTRLLISYTYNISPPFVSVFITWQFWQERATVHGLQ